MDTLTQDLLIESHLKWLREHPGVLSSTIEMVGWKAVFTATTDKGWVVAILN